MNQLAVVNRQQATLPTIIGQAPARFPIGGKIRAGIKVLTRAAARHPEAALIYEAGVKAGKVFEEIETEITRAVPVWSAIIRAAGTLVSDACKRGPTLA